MSPEYGVSDVSLRTIKRLRAKLRARFPWDRAPSVHGLVSARPIPGFCSTLRFGDSRDLVTIWSQSVVNSGIRLHRLRHPCERVSSRALRRLRMRSTRCLRVQGARICPSCGERRPDSLDCSERSLAADARVVDDALGFGWELVGGAVEVGVVVGLVVAAVRAPVAVGEAEQGG